MPPYLQPISFALQSENMDFFSPLSSSSSPSSDEVLVGERSCLVSQVLGRIICAIVTCISAIVGSLIGAITGALIGLATESGFLRGAGIGSISGAVFAIEVVESSLDLWKSKESGIWSVLYVLDILGSLFNGRLVREKVGPAVQSAVQSQMSAVNLPFNETTDFFETGGSRGLSLDFVKKIPKIKISSQHNLDNGGETICCSVCLQDFQIGETVRSLPQCRHIFHLPCIDNWLIRHGSCPLCRSDI